MLALVSSLLFAALVGAAVALFFRDTTDVRPSVWVSYTDDADGYVMACPPSFSISRFAQGATCIGPYGVDNVDVQILPTSAGSVGEWMAIPDKGAFEYESAAVAEGTMLGGEPAVRTTGVWSGRRYYALHDGRLFVVTAMLTPDDEVAFLARFRFLGN